MLTGKRAERSPEFDVYSDFDSFRFRRILGDGACACARVRMERGEGPGGGHQDIRTSYIGHFSVKNTIMGAYACVNVCVRARARARQQGSVRFTRGVN